MLILLPFQEPLLEDSAFNVCNALQEFHIVKDQEPDPYVKKWGESLQQIRQMYNQMAGLQHVLIGGLDSWAVDPSYAIGEEKKALDEAKINYEVKSTTCKSFIRMPIVTIRSKFIFLSSK